MPDLKPKDVLDDETALSVQVRETENKLVETRAVLEAVEAALEGKPVSDFMLSFPIVAKAQALLVEAQTRSGVVLDTSEEVTPYGTFTRVTVSADGVNEGVGLSRNPRRAVAFALQDLASKVMKTA